VIANKYGDTGDLSGVGARVNAASGAVPVITYDEAKASNTSANNWKNAYVVVDFYVSDQDLMYKNTKDKIFANRAKMDVKASDDTVAGTPQTYTDPYTSLNYTRYAPGCGALNYVVDDVDYSAAGRTGTHGRVGDFVNASVTHRAMAKLRVKWTPFSNASDVTQFDDIDANHAKMQGAMGYSVCSLTLAAKDNTKQYLTGQGGDQLSNELTVVVIVGRRQEDRADDAETGVPMLSNEWSESPDTKNDAQIEHVATFTRQTKCEAGSSLQACKSQPGYTIQLTISGDQEGNGEFSQGTQNGDNDPNHWNLHADTLQTDKTLTYYATAAEAIAGPQKIDFEIDAKHNSSAGAGAQTFILKIQSWSGFPNDTAAMELGYSTEKTYTQTAPTQIAGTGFLGSRRRRRTVRQRRQVGDAPAKKAANMNAKENGLTSVELFPGDIMTGRARRTDEPVTQPQPECPEVSSGGDDGDSKETIATMGRMLTMLGTTETNKLNSLSQELAGIIDAGRVDADSMASKIDNVQSGLYDAMKDESNQMQQIVSDGQSFAKSLLSLKNTTQVELAMELSMLTVLNRVDMNVMATLALILEVASVVDDVEAGGFTNPGVDASTHIKTLDGAFGLTAVILLALILILLLAQGAGRAHDKGAPAWRALTMSDMTY